MSREDDVARLFAATRDAFGRVDVLVNAAGIGLAGTIADGTVDDWRHVLDVNLAGTFLCCREAVRVMRSQGGGTIVNVASELALVGAAEIAAYAATKGGVLQLTRAMAADHTREGIRVNAVCPGPVDTPLLDALIAAADDPEASGGPPRDRPFSAVSAVPTRSPGRSSSSPATTARTSSAPRSSSTAA